MTATTKPVRHYLRNIHGWVFIYTVIDDNYVTLTKKYKGEMVDEMTLERSKARIHYAESLRCGFLSKDSTF